MHTIMHTIRHTIRHTISIKKKGGMEVLEWLVRLLNEVLIIGVNTDCRGACTVPLYNWKGEKV